MTSLVYGLLFASILSSSPTSFPSDRPSLPPDYVDKLILERIENHENELVKKININSLCQQVQQMINDGIKRKKFGDINVYDFLRYHDREYKLIHPLLICHEINHKFEIFSTQRKNNFCTEIEIAITTDHNQ
jgi:hypothetical protein